MMTLTQFSLKDIEKAYDAMEYHRGYELYLNKAVTNIKRVGASITSTVLNEQGTAQYDTVILPMFMGEKTSFGSICRCPKGTACHHAVATLIHAVKNPTLIQEDSLVKAPPPTKTTVAPRPVEIPEQPLPTEVSSWVTALEKAIDANTQKKTVHTRTPPTMHKRLVYVIHEKNGALFVRFIGATLKKDGQYAKQYRIFVLDELSALNLYAPEYIDPIDIELLAAGNIKPNKFEFDHPFTAITIDWLEKVVQTQRCFFDSYKSTPLTWGQEATGILSWHLESNGVQKLQSSVQDSAARVILETTPHIYLDPQAATIGVLRFPEIPANVSRALLQSPPIAPTQVPQVTQLLAAKFPNIPIALPQKINIERIHDYRPKIKFKIFFGTYILNTPTTWKNTGQRLVGALSFEYEGAQVPMLKNYSIFSTPTIYQLKEAQEEDGHTLLAIQRNTLQESEAIDCLKRLSWLGIDNAGADGPHLYSCQTDNESQFAHLCAQVMKTQVPQLEALGWEITIDANMPLITFEEETEWFANIITGGDRIAEFDGESIGSWFKIEMGITLDGKKVNILPMLLEVLPKFIDDKGNIVIQNVQADGFCYLRFDDNKYLPIRPERLKTLLAPLVELYKEKNDRISTWQAEDLAELEAALASISGRWFGGEALRKLGRELRDFTKIATTPPPASFQCQLRPYQQDGLNWLQFLRQYNLNGVLADDMGLGKTIQALAHIITEKEAGRLTKPALVVAPTSLMVNWAEEAMRFAPTLRTIVLHGSDRHKHFNALKEADLILTTYPLLGRDKRELLNYKYHFLILDEAQIIKNHKTQAHNVVQQLQANHRLCLTGTPMENHLGELWSLFHFLTPGLLGDHVTFTKQFRTPIEKEGSLERRNILTKRLKPFLLRRTKGQVAEELPEKTEIIQKIELTEKQRDLYESIRLTMHAKVRDAILKKGFARSQIAILDALLKLRQVCCDPRLCKFKMLGSEALNDEEAVDEAVNEAANEAALKDSLVDSAKLGVLLPMLQQLIEEKHQILLFSQFASMLRLLETALQAQNIPYVILTGQTVDRRTPIETFQSGKVPLFLISLKAGGTGLNLTAADTVIHYDPWWNPAAENQATDRAHRIGQTKAVFVYKLVTSGTVEEKIIEMQKKKQRLMDGILGKAETTELSLTAEDFEELLRA